MFPKPQFPVHIFKFLRRVRLPLLWPPGSNNLALSVEELRQAKALLESIRRDLQSNAFVKMPASVRQPLADFANRLVPLFALSEAILRPDNFLSTVSITLLNGEAQRQLSGPIFALPSAAAPTPPPPAGSGWTASWPKKHRVRLRLWDPPSILVIGTPWNCYLPEESASLVSCDLMLRQILCLESFR